MNRMSWVNLNHPSWFTRAASLMLAALVTHLSPAVAHELPADVRVSAFMRTEDSALRLLIRVPMKAMQEVEWPLKGPGYLDLNNIEPRLREAVGLWLTDNLKLFADGRTLGPPKLARGRISVAGDRSFASYSTAIEHVLHAADLDPSTELYWQEQWLDVLLEYPAPRDPSSISIDARFGRMGLQVRSSLRFKMGDHPERALEWHGNPGAIAIDPRWHAAALRFTALGIEHILTGIDHLLFALCLVVPFRRRVRALLLLVTAFTLAHSITIAVSGLGLAPKGLWFAPAVETMIAASIVWMAIENLLSPTIGLRFALAFGFGLIHGFGFAFALQEELQFAGQHLALALIGFNLGVEIGQLLVLAIIIPGLIWFSNRVDFRVPAIIVSLVIGHTAWHWLLERGEALMKFQVPAIDAAGWASILRWMLALLLMVWVLALTWPPLRRWLDGETRDANTPHEPRWSVKPPAA